MTVVPVKTRFNSRKFGSIPEIETTRNKMIDEIEKRFLIHEKTTKNFSIFKWALKVSWNL